MTFVLIDDLGTMEKISARLASIERKLATLGLAATAEKERDAMAQADIDALKAKVTANTDATNSAVSLIGTLAQLIRDNADDPVELRAIADQLEANSQSLGTAVTANTPQPPV